MSHTESALQQTDLIGPYVATLHVKNYGRTPAEITDMVIDLQAFETGKPLPSSPQYRRLEGVEPAHTVLVVGDFFLSTVTFRVGLQASAVTLADLAGTRDGTRTLYLLGYVDYIDKFGTRHRAGYARRHDPTVSGNNLVFVTQRGYNYDRERVPGEGADWPTEASGKLG